MKERFNFFAPFRSTNEGRKEREKRSEEEEMKYQFLRRSRREKKIIPRRQQWYNVLPPTFLSLSSNAYTFMAAILFGNRPQASPPSSQGRLFKPIRIIQFFVCHVPLGHFLVAITRGGPGQALFSTSMFAGRRVDFLPFSPSIIPTPLASRYLSLFIILVHPRIFFSTPPASLLVPSSFHAPIRPYSNLVLELFLFFRFALPNFLLQRSRLILSFSVSLSSVLILRLFRVSLFFLFLFFLYRLYL